MILAANAAVGVITETNAEKAIEVNLLDLFELLDRHTALYPKCHFLYDYSPLITFSIDKHR